MLHDPVTNTSPPSTNFYSHKPEDIITNNQAKNNINSRDMLPVTAGARRPNSVGIGKPERSMKSAAGTNGGGRWRLNGYGQHVDSVSAEWDIVDELGKLQLGDNASDRKSQMRTPPQMRGGLGAVGIESSPLESSSDSLGSDSPNAFEQANLASHSRGASADTTASQTNQTLHAGPYTPGKNSSLNEARNRPHSYSGGLSSADLVRLQQAGGSPGLPENWSSPNGTPERPAVEQPQYPSLVNQSGLSRAKEDMQGDFQGQQRAFNPFPQPHLTGVAPYQNNRAAPVMAGPQLRGRGAFPQVPATVTQTPPNFAFPTPLQPAPLPVGGGQHIYDMMLPTPPLENPAMARLQQQSPYRPGHQHSASDPASLRDPAMLALLNSNMQAAFAAGQMYGPSAMVPPTIALFNQFYGTPDAYASPDLAMMARLQPQFTGQYGIPTVQNAALTGLSLAGQAAVNASANGTGSAGGPNANNRKLGLYKTELCRSWEEKGSCRYGAKCQFAHGEEELRQVQRHPKYKTEICRTFWVSGSCPYGKRCCFIHTELPGTTQPGQDGVPPSANDTRPRSDSDPNESTSLLARISAKRQESPTIKPTPTINTTPPSAGLGGRPGFLTINTSVDPAANKQNKSAFPTFTRNGILVPAKDDDGPTMSPGPVTAGPDFGRHAAARLDIVGSQPRKSLESNVRHSFNGSDVQLDFNSSTPTATNQSQFAMTPTDVQPSRTSRINGHVRSGSAGNWASATSNRASHLTAYPLSSIPGNELKNNLPWADFAGSRRAADNWT
ncbi:hypothetical protein BDY19DRAFT_26810 [Irpex rosettiformis]|uniref:Uncharacterized protein n=1 Tax=Irpex rosettiformis TaxID=378272 RepID=A0ACB8UK05_9APHY|nr:hypothetical protein BDY19DRAFT_26810 [Irpex rosettiformis]